MSPTSSGARAKQRVPLTGHTVGHSEPDGDCLFDSFAQAYTAAPRRVRESMSYNLMRLYHPDTRQGQYVLDLDGGFLRTVVALSVLTPDPARDMILRQMHDLALSVQAASASGALDFSDEDPGFALGETEDLMQHMEGCGSWSPAGVVLDVVYRRVLHDRIADRRVYWGDTFAWHVLETLFRVRLLVVEKFGVTLRRETPKRSLISRKMHKVHMGMDHGSGFHPSYFVTLYKQDNHFMPLWFGRRAAVFTFADVPECLVAMCTRDFSRCRWYISLQVTSDEEEDEEEDMGSFSDSEYL